MELERTGQGVTIVARCADKLAPLAAGFIDRFLREAPVKPGAVSWWGPAPVCLREEGPRRFRFCQPDLREQRPLANPREDVTSVVALVAMIASITQAARVEPEQFVISDAMLTFRGALDMQRAYVHRKFAPERLNERTMDSGWYLGPDMQIVARMSEAELDRKENYKLERIWELYYRRPLAVAALALPREYIAQIDGPTVLEVVDPDNRKVWHRDDNPSVF